MWKEHQTMKDFDGKVVLVTGAGAGIGRASSLAFARAGGRVAVADIDRESGLETVAEIRAEGGEAEFFRMDISREEEVSQVFSDIIDRFGALDVAHNNAGIDTPPLDLLSTSTEAWNRVLAVNLTGVFHCLQAEVTYMAKNGGGTIVNTASISGLTGSYFHSAYTAAKFGVVGLTKCVALEYIQQGIRVNAVCPGAVNTNIMGNLDQSLLDAFSAGTPAGRMAEPEEIADAVLYLASDRSSFIVGQALPVDGGIVGASMSTKAAGALTISN